MEYQGKECAQAHPLWRIFLADNNVWSWGEIQVLEEHEEQNINANGSY